MNGDYYHVLWDSGASTTGKVIYRGPDVEHAKEAYKWATGKGDYPVHAYATTNGKWSGYLTGFVKTYLGVTA